MIDVTRTVADLVLDHSACASVFKKHRIDFCCRGGIPIDEACKSVGINVDELARELSEAISSRAGRFGANPRTASTPDLIRAIVATHHDYLRQALPFIVPLANKVYRVHGEHNPRLLALNTAVASLSDALLPHLDREETVLFPALLSETPDSALVAHELESMHEDHLAVGALLEDARAAADDYQLPDWACTSYRTLFSELIKMESDIFQHVHLENHVLMPRFVKD